LKCARAHLRALNLVREFGALDFPGEMDSAELLQDEPEAAEKPHDEDEDEDVVGRALSVAGAGAPRLFP